MHRATATSGGQSTCQIGHHSLRGHAQPLCGAVQNPLVGLMQHQEVYGVLVHARILQCLLYHLQADPHFRWAEHSMSMNIAAPAQC